MGIKYASNKIWNMEYEHEKRNTGHSPKYQMGNMGSRKLPNVGIWEEAKREIRNMEQGHFEI